MNTEYLMHYGVKGMKWGVRHDPYKKGSSSISVKKSIVSKYRNAVSSKNGKNRTPEEIAKIEHRKKIAKNIAIGVGVGVALGLIAVGAKPMVNKGHMEYKRITNRRSNNLATMPISELDGHDTILKAGETTLQRISKDSLENEKSKNVIYAAYTENDKAAYNAWFVGSTKNLRDPRKQQVFTRELNKDLRGPSERKRVMGFMQLVNTDPEFRDALLEDFHTIGRKKHLKYSKIDSLDTAHSRQYYGDFWRVLGDENSKSRQIYIDKKIKPVYDFINDDNDAGWHGDYPTIFLDSTNDTVITGMRAKTIQDEIDGLIKFNSFVVHGELL